jgi:hypothetical protein
MSEYCQEVVSKLSCPSESITYHHRPGGDHQ